MSKKLIISLSVGLLAAGFIFTGQYYGIPGISQGVTVKLLVPSGGEIWERGAQSDNIIYWSGGKGGIKIALTKSEATKTSDPTNLIVGWIETQPWRLDGGHNFPWDAAGLYSEDGSRGWITVPGQYKILIIGKDPKGNFTIWDAQKQKPGNIDISDQLFTIVPRRALQVITPKGGETFKIGDTLTVVINAVRLENNTVVARLAKGTGPYPPDGINSVLLAWLDFANFIADTGTYTATLKIDERLEPGDNYYIQVHTSIPSNLPYGLIDYSDGMFRIVKP